MTQADPSLCSEPSAATVMRFVRGPPDFAKPVISIWLRFMPGRTAYHRAARRNAKAGVPGDRPLRSEVHVQLRLHRARL